MKIALLGDLHFGARGDSEIFSEYFFDFFEKVFFPYLVKNKIKVCFQFGDIVDRRKIINIKTMKAIQDKFLPKFKEHGIKLIIFLGNHDTYHKNTNEVNALNVLFDGYDNIRVIDRPKTIDIGDLNIDIIPWINAENYDKSMAFVEASSSDYCFGHFEFAGFEMQAGIEAHGGMSIKPFKQYKHVYSGHYHHHSNKGNITYLGTPYEITWADYNDAKGFMVLDLANGKSNFIKNLDNMFHKFTYEKDVDSNKVDYKNKIVKVYVDERDSQFDTFMGIVNESNPHSVTVIDTNSFDKDDVLSENIEVEDTLVATLKVVGQLVDINQDKMTKLVTDIYNEASNI